VVNTLIVWFAREQFNLRYCERAISDAQVHGSDKVCGFVRAFRIRVSTINHANAVPVTVEFNQPPLRILNAYSLDVHFASLSLTGGVVNRASTLID
jgi:hypothetical protein